MLVLYSLEELQAKLDGTDKEAVSVLGGSSDRIGSCLGFNLSQVVKQ